MIIRFNVIEIKDLLVKQYALFSLLAHTIEHYFDRFFLNSEAEKDVLNLRTNAILNFILLLE
jgi:hypothetical protein